MVKYVKADYMSERGDRYLQSELYEEFEHSDKAIEQKIFNLLDRDSIWIILSPTSWYVEKGHLPKYAKDYLKKYIKSKYGVDYLYDIPLSETYLQHSVDKRYASGDTADEILYKFRYDTPEHISQVKSRLGWLESLDKSELRRLLW